MKKNLTGIAAALLAGCLLAGCGDRAAVTNRDLSDMQVSKYVTLGDYNHLSVSVPPVTVDQGEWDKLTLALYQSYVSADNGGITDRAVEIGDTVIIDYEGKKDGVAFAGGTASGADLTIGSGQFIKGFEEGLIGVLPGTTVDLNLSFPEGYGNQELAGAAVVFTVTVQYILPDKDQMKDSVVAAVGIPGVGTVEELRQYAYNYLLKNAETNYRYQVQDAIMGQLLEQSVIEELPQTFVDSYNSIISDSLASIAGSYGVDSETYSNYYGMNTEQYVSRYSQMQAKQDVLLQAIANQENLVITDEELQEKLEELRVNAGYSSVEELLKLYDKEEYRNYLMGEKVMDYLMENTVISTQ